MRIKRLAVLLLIAAAGCTSGGGGEEREAARSRHGEVSASRPSHWTAAKVSFFSTQSGGLLQQHTSNPGMVDRFGMNRRATYLALVNDKWWQRDFHKAIEEQAYDIAYTKGYAQQDSVTLDEPFEQGYKPFVKVVKSDVLARVIDGLGSKGFFDMPTVTDVPMSRGPDGKPVVAQGHAWLMVQLDDWRRTVAFDALRGQEVQDFLDITGAVAGAFTAAPSPQATVVLDPVQVWDKNTLKMMGREAAKKPVDADERVMDTEDKDGHIKKGQIEYYNAPKADPKWMEKKPQTTEDSLENFLKGK